MTRSQILDAQYELDRMREDLASLRDDENERRRLIDMRIGHVNRSLVQVSGMVRSLLAAASEAAAEGRAA